MESVFYSNLNGADKKNYDALVRAVRTMQRSVNLLPMASVHPLFGAVLRAHPEFFYLSTRYRESLGIRKTLFLNYLYRPTQIRKLTQELERKADEIMGQLINAHQSDYDKVLVLHDYLKSTIIYDEATMKQIAFGGVGDPESSTIVGALLNRKAVCGGFAEAMKYLCDRAGVECHVVEGKGNNGSFSGNHSWNIVKINGVYQHVDVTWDNQSSVDYNIPNYSYFNLDDETISRDHTWTRKDYPKCDVDSYNYFKVNGADIDSRAQLGNFLYNNFECEEPHIIFRVVRGSKLEMEIAGSLDDIVSQSAGKCKFTNVSNFTWYIIPEQCVYMVVPDYG